jgi:hypothetical protein
MSSPALARATFAVSRLAKFASKGELAKLVGHVVDKWSLVAFKELADIGIDQAEEIGVAPKIEASASTSALIVADLAGRGIGLETVDSLVDYTTRTLSREAYVSPTRGQQGNALQAIIAMPFALDGEKGETIIEARRAAHRFVFTVDPVRHVALIEVERTASPDTSAPERRSFEAERGEQ